ncbi:hypothetical protein [Halorussus sp. MSC15.2]|uniref:DUF7269 family protein n=1 Tax=Halorussus sp. MSC15.2 TaxID=2283638 RepID=UPI0013D6113E|nr:hypothetical protein [Halorussus sp. MSC15.2]NEU57083.1 hypothetical protein [Halorussus sp. MSC15.2]
MRARVLGGLGALLTLAAAAVVVAPGLAAPVSAAVGVLESQSPERLLLVLGSVVGAYAAWAARGGTAERPPTDSASAIFEGVGARPESVSATDRTRTGEAFDRRVAAACDGDDRALRAVRATLADTAASAHARAADRTPDRARRAVETGAWTDDPIAAAFLADESGPRFSLPARLRAWLDPAAERRRRVERTIDAVGRVFDREDGTDSERDADDGTDGQSDASGDGGESR